MFKLFSGSHHVSLSKKVAEKLDVELSNAEIIRFGNSECRVRIEDVVNGMHCAVIQPISNPTDEQLMELMFFADALRRSGAEEIIAVIPYFGYARQDIQHRMGECVSFHVVVSMLEAIGFTRIITIDLHDEASRAVFEVPFYHSSALPILARSVKSYLSDEKENIAFITADHSGIERARAFGEAYMGHSNFEIVVVEKKRNISGIHDSKAVQVYGDIYHKIAIVVDDIATSSKTIVNAAHMCLEQGANRAIAAVTHHDFADEGPLRIQKSNIEAFFTTNTIPMQESWAFEKLQEVDISNIIVESLETIIEDMK